MHRSGENGRRPVGRTGQIAYLILRCPTLACLASRCYVSDVIFIRSLSYGWRSRIWVEYVSLGRRLRHPFKTTIYPKKKKMRLLRPPVSSLIADLCLDFSTIEILPPVTKSNDINSTEKQLRRINNPRWWVITAQLSARSGPRLEDKVVQEERGHRALCRRQWEKRQK